jgi:hypothetical protein
MVFIGQQWVEIKIHLKKSEIINELKLDVNFRFSLK